MSLFSIILIAVGLSADAFAVSVTNGMLVNKLEPKYILRPAIFFGGFQALMPLIGWLAGYEFKDYIISFDHWIAFALLAFIGGRMIYETLKNEPEGNAGELAMTGQEGLQAIPAANEKIKLEDNKYLLMLAVATSIDALAVGVSFAFLRVSVLNAAVIIGVTTFILSSAGVAIGKKFGELFKKQAELAGGIILILIGLNILFEHLGIYKILAALMK